MYKVFPREIKPESFRLRIKSRRKDPKEGQIYTLPSGLERDPQPQTRAGARVTDREA